jgi:predicted RNA-binding protein with PUA-like domain
MPKPQHWLIKSEPSVYAYAQLEKDKKTEWTGVRNFEARNNLRAMKVGDLCLYYHSNEGKEIVAVAEVVGPPQPDSTAPGEDWASVWVAPRQALKQPVTLAVIKQTASLADLQLITRSRLSVVPVSPIHFRELLKMGKTKLG